MSLLMLDLYFAMTFQFCIISKNSLVLQVADELPLAQWLPAHLHCFVSISGAFPGMAFFFFFLTENLCLFIFGNHGSHLIRIFNYVSLQSGASVGLF